MASWAGSGAGTKSGVTKAQLDAVLRAVRLTPIIDNHAHPLLKPDALGRHPLMSIITEASGDAIHAASTSFAHHRAVKQLSRVLGCGATWENVVSAIEEKRVDEDDAWYNWVSECLGGIETILIDDGLDNEQDVQDIAWHDQYTRNQCKRIVRLEAIAAAIINRHGMDYEKSMSVETLFDTMLDEFDTAIKEAIDDPEVVGFKSVICYRTGLDIPKIVNIARAKDSFADIVTNFGILGQFKRLQHDGLNDLFVHRVAGLIRECPARHKKPIQFHTGLGDNDITLTKSSPSHLQEFIRAYPEVPIVILHASYPFTREAGYLACVYANVYADIGEVFPFVSEDGQEHIVKQILELCPWSKILWSTDGHWFPETYLLATLQVREVLATVLTDFVRKGHIGWKAAIELTRDILFHNSNKLYQLGLEFSEWNDDPSPTPYPQKGLTDDELFDTFLQGNSPPKFVRINWTDLTATPRMRMVPFRKFITTLQEGNSVDIGIAKASLGLLQNDWISPGFSGTGEYRLHPDFSSLKWGPIKGHASTYGEFREKDGSRVRICPRTQLHRAVDIAAEHGLSYLIGFEIEFLLVERSKSGDAKFETLTNDGHAWSVSQFFVDPKIPKLLADIVAELDSIGIFVEQIHPESAPGQFELVLPPLPPVEAVDTLLHTREVISAMAAHAGYRFTLHPKPFPSTPGTASHAHMSISSSGGSKPQVYEKFYAGVLKHLCAILAFTYSNPASYERLGDSVWAGGTWVSWGSQNRETAFRKIEDSHWEFKLLDGLANPYLAMAAIFLAGTNGVITGEKLLWRDCEIDPAQLTENDRKELNVTKKLPNSLEAALKALEEDEEMKKLLGPEMVEKYTSVKLFELQFLSGMGDEERRQWIMERY